MPGGQAPALGSTIIELIRESGWARWWKKEFAGHGGLFLSIGSRPLADPADGGGGNILQIALLDHVIVGDCRWFSFKEAGLV